MAYAPLEVTKPTTAGSPTPTRQQSIDDTRENIAALRDLLVASGVVQGFDFSIVVGAGSNAEPEQWLYKRGVEWIKLVLTWGTTGGEYGQVVKTAFYYSSNSGGVYAGMADDAGKYVLTYTYDANGYCTAAVWGSTP